LNDKIKEFKTESDKISKKIQKKYAKSKSEIKTPKIGLGTKINPYKKFGTNFGTGNKSGFFGKIKEFLVGSNNDQVLLNEDDKGLLTGKKYNTLTESEKIIASIKGDYIKDFDTVSEPEYTGETKDPVGLYKIRKARKKLSGILGRILSLITNVFKFFILYPLLLIMDIMTYVELFVFRIPLFILFSLLFLFLGPVAGGICMTIMFFGTFLEYIPFIGPIAMFVNLFISFAVDIFVFLPDLILTIIDFFMALGSLIVLIVGWIAGLSGLGGAAAAGVGAVAVVGTEAIGGGGGTVTWGTGEIISAILSTLQLLIGLPPFVVSIFQTDFIGVIMGIIDIIMWAIGLIPFVGIFGSFGSMFMSGAKVGLKPLTILPKIGKIIAKIIKQIENIPDYIEKLKDGYNSLKVVKTGAKINKAVEKTHGQLGIDKIENFAGSTVGVIGKVTEGASFIPRAIDMYSTGKYTMENTKDTISDFKGSISGLKDSVIQKQFDLGNKLIKLASSFSKYISYILDFTGKYTLLKPFHLVMSHLFSGIVATIKKWKPGQTILNKIAILSNDKAVGSMSFGKMYKKSLKSKTRSAEKIKKKYKSTMISNHSKK
jgi:hypothetical protein